MFLSISAALILVANPPDPNGCAGPLKAVVASAGIAQSLGIRTAELKAVLPIPTEYHGDVALLLKAPNLLVFGTTRFERTRFETIEIWGFEKRPLPVMSIFLDAKPSTKPRMFFPVDSELAFLALQNAPELLKFVQSKGYFNFTPEQAGLALAKADKLLDQIVKDSQTSGVEAVTWEGVRWNLLRREHERFLTYRGLEEVNGGNLPLGLSQRAREAATPNPPNREPSSTKFGSFLNADGYAVAMIEDVFAGKDQGRVISLHPKFRNTHRPFANPIERIQIEGRFQIRWLGLTDPLVFELDSPSEFRKTYLIFERSEDVPENLILHRVDAESGDRIPG